MRIIGICTVRDEEDIIGQSLRHAAQQLDLILVVDCGSQDSSVSEIENVCSEFKNVFFLGKLEPLVSEQVRRHIWAKFRNYFKVNDWWAIVDSDEFIEDNFKEKVEQATSQLADHISSVHVNFYYTESEAKNWYEGKETLADRTRPIQDRRKFYSMNTSQIRLFRNLPWLRWFSDTSFPEKLSNPAKERIIYFHYQYRDIPQIEKRIKVRSKSIPQQVLKDNPHWLKRNVKQAISSDNNPNLHIYEPRRSLIPSPSLPPAISQNFVKSFAKYTLAILKGLKKQPETLWFSEIAPEDILSRLSRSA